MSLILGAGHNGLMAAAYRVGAGLSVLPRKKTNYIGGATTSQKVFPDYDAHLSRYSVTRLVCFRRKSFATWG